jgi:predicted RNase H-like HicB family nuclease
MKPSLTPPGKQRTPAGSLFPRRSAACVAEGRYDDTRENASAEETHYLHRYPGSGDRCRVIASVPGFPGCHAYGRSPSAAVRKVQAALEFYLTELRCAGLEIPRQPRPVAVDIQVAV